MLLFCSADIRDGVTYEDNSYRKGADFTSQITEKLIEKEKNCAKGAWNSKIKDMLCLRSAVWYLVFA